MWKFSEVATVGFLYWTNIREVPQYRCFLPVGFLLCHQQLQNPEAYELWKQALHGGYVTTLCRDEVVHMHLFIVAFFETIKG